MIKRYLARRKQRIQARMVNDLIKKSTISIIEPIKKITEATNQMLTVINSLNDVLKEFTKKYKHSTQPSYLRVHQGLKSWK